MQVVVILSALFIQGAKMSCGRSEFLSGLQENALVTMSASGLHTMPGSPVLR